MPLGSATLISLILLTAAFGAGCSSGASPDAPEIPATPDAPAAVPAPRRAAVPEPEPPSFPVSGPADAAEAVSLVLPPDPETGKFIRKDSYLSHWMLRSSAMPGDAQTLLNGKFPESAPGGWRAVSLAAPENDAPTLGEQLSAADTVACLAARLDSSRPLTGLKLHLGGGGLQQLTLNGELLYTDTRGARPADAPPEEIPDVTLRKGENHLRIRTVRIAPEWNVRLRLTDAAGAPLRFAPCGAQP